MHIMITGVAGFIGSHFATYLIEKGHQVTGCDNLSSGSVARLSHILEHPKFRFHHADVRDYKAMSSLLNHVDWVCHLAGEVGVRNTVNRPASAFKVNVLGTETVFEIAQEKGCNVLLGSTSEVYGNPEQTNQALVEDQSIVLPPPVHPRWAYAASKAAAEYLATSFACEHDVHSVICRFFNVTGPGQLPESGMVVPVFVAKALRNEPLVIYGDGSQTRCFTYVADAVTALYKVMMHPQNKGEIVNIGSTQEISIRDLAQCVIRQLNSRSEIMFEEADWQTKAAIKDIKRRVPNVEKLQKMTNFTPETDLSAIINACAKAYYTAVPAP